MLLPDRRVQVCPLCRQPIWVEDCRSAEPDAESHEDTAWPKKEENPYKRCEGFKEARRADLKQWMLLLQPPPNDPERERYLRTRIWWRKNDRRRRSEDPLPLTPKESANLAMLAALLDETDPGDLLTKAEIMRELGRFRQAATLVARVPEVDLPKAAEIRKLIEAGDSRVRRLESRGGGEIHIYV